MPEVQEFIILQNLIALKEIQKYSVTRGQN